MTATPPDNTSALAATTAADAMSKSAYNCSKGDDTTCVTAYGTGACCFWGSVESVSADTTLTSFDLAQAQIGWPTAAGTENTFCMDMANVAYYAAFTTAGEDKENTEWTQYYNGSKMKGYCVSAMKIASSVSAAAAVVFATSF